MRGTIDTGLNGVPEEWDLTSFGKCAEIVAGQSPKGDTYNTSGDGIPLLNGPAEFGARTPTAVQWTTKPSKLAQKDDVLFCVRGNTTGRMNIADGEYCIGRGLAAIREVEGKTTTPFVYFLLCLLRPSIYAIATAGGSTFPNISKSTLAEFQVGIPPLPEQKKIAHILSTVQRAIEAQERIIQTTTELKKALMHKLFTEGLRGERQKQTEIGPVPESWEVVDLGEVINLFAGYAFKSAKGVSESNTQLLRMGNLYQNTLDLTRSPIFYPDSFATVHKRFVLKEGDLLMSLTGTSGKEDYGFTVRIPRTDKALLLNQRVTRIDVTDQRLQKDFAHHFLLSRKFLDHLYPTAKGMKQANLSTNAMKKLKVVLPGEAEQVEIATCFKSLDQKVGVAGRKVAALQDLFRTLLHQLMTAQVRVNELELEMKN